MRILTSDQIKTVEQIENETGMKYIRLMENAGSACARFIREKFDCKRVTIVSGAGKNGGDGFVIARKLCEYGIKVTVVLAAGRANATDAIEMLHRLKSMPVVVLDYFEEREKCEEAISNTDMIVDAIFGIGFYGEPNSIYEQIFDIINDSDAVKLAVDIPSGTECDTGKIEGTCIRADYTIAISTLKPAHVMFPASEYCGRVGVVEIGIDESCYANIGETATSIEIKDVKEIIKPRKADCHKGDFGRALCICGSYKMPGAAVLAVNGAVRSGAGLVTAAIPKPAYEAVTTHTVESLVLPLDANEEGTLSITALPQISEAMKKADVVLIGCGLGLNAETKEIVYEVIKNSEKPVIIDADGINAVADNIDILKAAKAPIILTPHPGEMARLANLTVSEVQESRIERAKSFARENDVTLVLKGAGTVIATVDGVYINRTGNAGMAKGGTGDLLSGIMTAFVAQGMNTKNAAICAAHIHGAAGDKVASKISKMGMTASDMLKVLPLLLSEYE